METVLPAVKVSPRRIEMGEIAPVFRDLPGADGRRYSLSSFEGRTVLVLAFLGNLCPAVRETIPKLVELQSRIAEKGGQVLGVNSNNPHLSTSDSLPHMVEWSDEHHLNFPYVKDHGGELAKACGARNTPDFVVLDRERRLRYRGRMFDSRDPERATTRDLEDAVETTIAGGRVPVPETQPLGCSIVW